MSSTPCASEALDRLIAPWAAKIAKSAATTVEAIVAIAENVGAAVQALKPHGQKARHLLAARSGLSRPMLSKLETIGRHAGLLRRNADTLPPSVSSLYALARMPSPELERAVVMDLRGKSRAEIEAMFAGPAPPKPMRKLMTIALADDLEEPARRALMADIKAALERIAQDYGAKLDIVSTASGTKGADELCGPAPDTAKHLESRQRQGERPDARTHDGAVGKLMGLDAPAARVGGGQPGFFTGENPIESQAVAAHGQRSQDPAHGVLLPQGRKPGRSELRPLTVLSREREDICRRLDRLESSLMQRRSFSGSDDGQGLPQAGLSGPAASRTPLRDMSLPGEGASR